MDGLWPGGRCFWCRPIRGSSASLRGGPAASRLRRSRGARPAVAGSAAAWPPPALAPSAGGSQGRGRPARSACAPAWLLRCRSAAAAGPVQPRSSGRSSAATVGWSRNAGVVGPASTFCDPCVGHLLPSPPVLSLLFPVSPHLASVALPVEKLEFRVEWYLHAFWHASRGAFLPDSPAHSWHGDCMTLCTSCPPLEAHARAHSRSVVTLWRCFLAYCALGLSSPLSLSGESASADLSR